MQEAQAPAGIAPPLDLRGYLAVLRRRKWSILFITAVAVASALTFSFRQTPIYESTSKVQVKPTNPTVPISMDTERQVAGSTSVADLVITALGTKETPEALLEDLSVSVPTNSQILEFRSSDPDPVQAKKTAEAFAVAYLKFKNEQANEALSAERQDVLLAIDRLKGQLRHEQAILTTAVAGSKEALEAQNRIDTLTPQIAEFQTRLSDLNAGDQDPGDIIEHADLPDSPASPNHVMNGGLALLLGLALGVGLAFLRERLDDRIAGREEFEEAIGAPTLSVVPRVTGWRKKKRAELQALKAPKGAPAEAYRAIRTNLLFIARDGGIKTIAITSPATGEGKTTTAANLAVSLAQAEKRVIVVSCDLRKPRLHHFFNLNNHVGVSSVLTGKATLADAIMRPVGARTLRVVPSGPVPNNPADLMSSERMDALLAQLRKVADFVIIDTPPTLVVSDGLILAPKVDAVILVADAATTSRGAARHLREELEQVGGNIIGGVFNNFDPARAKYYTSYGSYYGGYRYEPEKAKRSKRGAEGEITGPSPEEIWRTEDIWT